MKKKVFKLLLTKVCLLVSTNVLAYDFEVNGLYYDVVSMSELTCKVVGNDKAETYTRDIVIPATFNYDGMVWTVVEVGALSDPSLTSVIIPNSVNTISPGAFSYCTALTSVTIPTSVTAIGNAAFLECSSLTSITIPNSVTTIDVKTFYGCSSLMSVQVPNSVTIIGSGAFWGCRSLIDAPIGNAVTTIGSGAFSGCSTLTNVIIPQSVTTIEDRAFENCTSLTNVVIPNSVAKTGKSMFQGCINLTSVTIGNSVTSIDSWMFEYCSSLTNVTLGNSVASIGQRAFTSCDALTTLYSFNTVPPKVEADNFTYKHYMNTNIYVPQEVLTAYQSAEPWKGFKNLQGIEVVENEPVKCATPTIHYANNKLTFYCDTEDVIFGTKITDTDISSYIGSEIQLNVTYNISVCATKAGYEDSDVATATLCWIDVDPKTEGIDTDVAQVRANAVLIQAINSQIDVTGLNDGTKVIVYNIDGTQIGSAISRGGQATVNVNMTPSSIAIVKIGDRSIKVTMK